MNISFTNDGVFDCMVLINKLTVLHYVKYEIITCCHRVLFHHTNGLTPTVLRFDIQVWKSIENIYHSLDRQMAWYLNSSNFNPISQIASYEILFVEPIKYLSCMYFIISIIVIYITICTNFSRPICQTFLLD